MNFGKNAKLINLVRLSGGASQETWSFDVAMDNDATHELILRRVPGGSIEGRNSTALPLSVEALLLKLAAKESVPAPKVVSVFEPNSEIGESFVMERVAGETIARKILRDEVYDVARSKLTQDCATALAKTHATPLSELPNLNVSNGIQQLEHYEGVFRSFEIDRPVFEFAIKWLKENAPPPRSDVLVHGDFRLGNLIVDQNGLAAVLDWELAHIGDPREDIAWMCVNSWRFGQSENRVGGFGQLTEFLDIYAEQSDIRFAEVEIDWWEALGSLKWGIMCMIMYESYRSKASPTVERAAIGRRVSETEIDLLNIISRS